MDRLAQRVSQAELRDESGQAKPWFLWLAYSAPHQPFHLPPGHLHARSGLTGSAADIAARPRQYYLAAIEAMDAEIGRLLASMDPATRANTLILFVGDNGTPQQAVDPSVFNSRRVKGTLFEGGIRVPMIVSGKGVGLSNSREAALVNTVDFYATIAHIAGHSATQIGNSYSFAALLQSGGVAMRQYNYSEFQSTSVNGWTVRDARFKLIQNDSGTQELYDLSTDLTEQNNLLSGGADYSATVNALKLYGTELRR